jgi:hypothetical protein
MIDEQDMVAITKKEFKSLLEDSNMLCALENAGVDSWDGYDYAIELLEAMDNDG